MMKRIVLTMTCLCCVLPHLAAQQLTHAERARQLWEWIKTDQTDSIYSRLDNKMQSLVSTAQLEGMWQKLEQQFGKCQKEEEWKQDTMEGTTVYFKDLVFPAARLRFLTAFDADGRANTLRILPAPHEEKPAPAAFDSTRIAERPIEVVTGPYRLPGTVTFPKEKVGVPVVVLVHGSGPQDRDETIGANKPFRDLAWTLAEKGMAVVRYDKRTKAYGAASAPAGKPITPDEETVDDALSAIHLGASLPFADRKRVFLAGHSLGALLAPRIATRTDSLAGIICLAAPARPFMQVAEAQIRYLASLNGIGESDIQQQIRQFKKSLPEAYLRYLEQYQPVMTAFSLKLPMLFLQGGRDYQVSMEDFSLWKLGLFGKPNVTFKSFPALNHLFMTGSGKPTPLEYTQPGHMSAEVAETIAKWVDAASGIPHAPSE